MKRTFDLVLSIFILVIFLPFGICIALLIVFSSKGNVFYRQKRVGKDQKEFLLYKFRTMRPNSDHFGQLTVGMSDPRITKVGYFIRKYKLDEFPQFLNVLKGEMSIVGPRPEVKEYVNYYTVDQLKVLKVKPGITDYASLHYFNENELLGKASDPKKTYLQEIMPAKLLLNEKYVREQSILVDLKIIWQTFVKILS